MSSPRKGINVAEVLGIIAMVGVLCGAFVPHLLRVDEADRLSKLRFNLQKLRQRIDDFRSRHGRPPSSPQEAFSEEPVEAIPDNPFSVSIDEKNRVREIYSDEPTVHQAMPAGIGGWLYNPVSGKVWPDHADFLSE